MGKKKTEDISLEEALMRLEETVERMQKEEVSLEESFLLYQQGMEYVKFCTNTIDKVEKKVLMLNQEGNFDEFSE